MKYLLYLITMALCLGFQQSRAQYTETINSNRPGTSQGGYAVGHNVLQFESGLGFGSDKHNLLNSDLNRYGIDYGIRYGLLFEELEISLFGNYLIQSGTIDQPFTGTEDISQNGFTFNTLGAKYLLFDPYKRMKEDKPNLYSWKANQRFKLKRLIPAVSIYAGANIMFSGPFTQEGEGISPKVTLATQSGLTDRLVLVTNFTLDRISTEFPITNWIVTVTHALRNPKWALFGEYEGQKSDLYSDDLFRVGGAHLFSKHFQVDANAMFNLKNTPSRFLFSVGVSYRYDMHDKDKVIRDKKGKAGIEEDPIPGQEGIEGGVEGADGEILPGIEDDGKKKRKRKKKKVKAKDKKGIDPEDLENWYDKKPKKRKRKTIDFDED